MKRSIQISIPTPCHENWDAMTPADKGRFCASCRKTVFDFTNSSDREISSVLKNTDNACGRFRKSQLDRELIVPKEKSRLWIAASAAIVSFLTIGNHSISAQTPISTEQTDSKTDEIIIGKPAAPLVEKITGIVWDENNDPLPGVSIIIKGTSMGIQTDMNGRYEILATPNDNLIFSYVGYNNEIISVGKTKSINVVMNSNGINLQGDIMIIRKRTFFGRIFHSVGNIQVNSFPQICYL